MTESLWPQYATHDLATIDLSDLNNRFWDGVALHQPLSLADIVRRDFVGNYAATWREYERFHEGVTIADAPRLDSEARRWQSLRLLDRALANGWMTETDGLITLAAVPPGHTPLATEGGMDAIQRRADLGNLPGVDDRDIVRVLMSKNELRREPKPTDVRRLRASIEQFGQLAPILVWAGKAKDADGHNRDIRFVVDGQTRLDILTDLGLLAEVRHLGGSPLRAILMRIDCEVAQKGMDEVGRKRYLKDLDDIGWSPARIAERIEASKAAVSRVQTGIPRVRITAETPEYRDRVIELHTAGWPALDIGQEAGSTATVNRIIGAWRVEQGLAPALKLPTGKVLDSMAYARDIPRTGKQMAQAGQHNTGRAPGPWAAAGYIVPKGTVTIDGKNVGLWQTAPAYRALIPDSLVESVTARYESGEAS
jgi:ParB-like chromosome segregation protein Spo0J